MQAVGYPPPGKLFPQIGATVRPALKGVIRAGFSVIHHVPGRLQIKVSGAAGDLAFFRALEQFIGTVSGVARVRADPLSSSVMIDYAPADTLLPQRLLGKHSLNQWLHLKQPARSERDLVDDGLRYLERHSRPQNVAAPGPAGGQPGAQGTWAQHADVDQSLAR